MGNLLKLQEVGESCDMFEETIIDTLPQQKLANKEEIFSSVYMEELYKCGVDDVLKSLKVTLLGRVGTGKSYLVSKLVKHEEYYRDVFCGDCGMTFCNVINIISNSTDMEVIRFHTDFMAGSNAELADRIARLVNKNVPLDGSTSTKELFNEMRALTAEIMDISHGEKSVHIDVFLQPNDYSTAVLEEKERKSIIITDTPGVSGNVNVSRITESNLYVIMLRSDNEQEAATLQKIAQKLELVIPTGKVLFLYRVEGVIDGNDYNKVVSDYASFEKHAQNEVLLFEKHFSSIRRHVVFTKNELLDMGNSCIAFPTMTTDDRWNGLFLDRFKAVLKDSVAYNETKAIGDSLRRLRTTGLRYDVLDFAKSILYQLPPHNAQNGDFTKLNFRSMVYADKSEDWNYELIPKVLAHACHVETTALDQYFSHYLVGNHQKYEEFVIKFVYYKLRESVNHNYHISVADSVFAKEILCKCENCPQQDKTTLYTEAMKECGLDSEFGNYKWPNDDTFVVRLKIARDIIGTVSASNAEDFILRTHVCGLRKYAEYEILKELGMPEDEAMKTIKELPF